jgi:hypothetical protein
MNPVYNLFEHIEVFSFIPVLDVFLFLVVLSINTVPIQAQVTTNAYINSSDTGRIFDGVGGLSGGGGTSALLRSYPQQQRDEILDYLFKPNYGANLQILKVEIGCDANSTNGAEASHMRSRNDSDYFRGYEWWLMEQAKLRNPDIKFYGLEWGAPGWFNGGFWSQDNINYIISWIKHAQSDHNLHIDYIGGWNESGWNKSWYEDLKKALKENNLTTKIVAADSWWNVTDDLSDDSTFRASVDVLGTHYPCGWMAPEMACSDDTYTPKAEKLNMPLWASESGTQNYDAGAVPLARALNRDYIDSRITAYINWTLVAAWYSTLPYYGDGLMLADQPWSGFYHVGKSIWVMAQTAQFTKIGWQYLDNACGFLGGNRNNGSYVTLKSPDSTDYTTVIETVDATSVQKVNFTLTGNFPSDTLNIWSTNLNSSDESEYFVHIGKIIPDSGKYSVALNPGYVYTVTTTSGQGKGPAVSPASAVMQLPYTENFNEYSLGAIPRFFDNVQGAFEADSAKGGRSGICLRQQINTAPIMWGGGSPTSPLTVMGDPGWSNYGVSIDVLIEQSGYVELIGRLGAQAEASPGASQGYHLRLESKGTWSLFKEDIKGNDTQLGSGASAFGLNEWHSLSLWFKKDTIKAFIDSALITSITDHTYGSGQIGLLVSKWQNGEFDNLVVDTTGSGSGAWISVDDAVQGRDINTFNYIGSGWQHCTGCGTELFDQTNTWDNISGDYMLFAFSGTQIKFYGVKDPRHGIGAVSIDDGEETNIDFYASERSGNQLMWTSPVLDAGNHFFKLRVTGSKNPYSSDSWVVPDRVEILSTSVTGIKQSNIFPVSYYLFQNYPNPFNPNTLISYQLPASSQVTIKIYDVLGRKLKTLVDEKQGPGKHNINFNAEKYSSGVYLYTINAVGDNGKIFNSVKKMILIK